MKKSFNIEDESLKKNPFTKRVADQAQIKSEILNNLEKNSPTQTSQRIVYSAAAAVVVFIVLFSALSRIDYKIDLYNNTPIAAVEATQFETYELNQLSLIELNEETEVATADVQLTNIENEDIIEYLASSDLSTYDLEYNY